MIDVTKIPGFPDWTPGAGNPYTRTEVPEAGFTRILDMSRYGDYTGQTHDWYRSPEWGGHISYNPYLGWQDTPTVAAAYGAYRGDEPFAPLTQLGLTPQTSHGWEYYFPDRVEASPDVPTPPPPVPETPSPGVPTPSPGNTEPPPDMGWLQDFIANFGQYYGPLDATTGGFPTTNPQISLPSEWGTASSVLGDFATGMPTDIPQSWVEGLTNANAMAATGLPTATPDSWTQGIQNANTMAATGAPTATPDIWNQGMSDVNAMASTGAPTDVSGIYNSWLPVAQQQMKDFSQSEAERLGLTGMRWSTPLQNRVSDYARQMSEQFGLDISQQQVQADEAAKARQLQAMPLQYQYGEGVAGLDEAAKARQLQAVNQQYQFGQGQAALDEAAKARQAQGIDQQYQYGAGRTGLTEAAKDRGLSGAQGLAGLGQAITQYPMDLAQLSMNLGLQGQQAQQGVYDRMYNEFLRTSAEGSPWLQNAMALLGIGGGSYSPQQYQQSGLSQILGGAGSLGMGALGFGSLCNKGG